MSEKPIAPGTDDRVIFFGVVLSMLLSAANAYLGLFAGMTVSAAIPAAVMALGIMRFFRNSTIYECNLIGTCASAGESLAAGVIFTLAGPVAAGFLGAIQLSVGGRDRRVRRTARHSVHHPPATLADRGRQAPVP